VCCFSRLPWLGFWEMTSPFARADPTAVTFPTEQNAFLIAALAAAIFLPTRSGTVHGRSTNFAPTATVSVVVILHLWRPLQAPDQPENLEPLAAFAFSVTEVPKA